jgi:hypothetical protein
MSGRLFPVTLGEQIREVENELRMRQRVYANRIQAGKMSTENATRKTDAMRAVLDTLIRLRDGLETPR